MSCTNTLEFLQYLDNHEPQRFDFCIECTVLSSPGTNNVYLRRNRQFSKCCVFKRFSIEQYENTRIKQRTNNKTLNKIYDQDKEIRKLEFRRGARKHIHTIKGTTDKQQILDHIKTF